MSSTQAHRRRLVGRSRLTTLVLTALVISLGLRHTGSAPGMTLDPADRDLAGIVPALPTVPEWSTGTSGSVYFAVHLRGYQGVKEQKVILGLEEEADGPCVRFDDSGGFSFATTQPGGIAWDRARGASNAAVTVYRAIVHNWHIRKPTNCEKQDWNDAGAAMGMLAIRFEPTSIRIQRFGIASGVECQGGCTAGWNRLLGDSIVLTAEQRADLANPMVPQVVIPFRYRASFTDDSASQGEPCYEDEVQRKDVNCTWTGASLAYLHLIRLASQDEFTRIVEAGAKAATDLMTGNGAGGTTIGGGGTGGIPPSGIGSPLVGWVPCRLDPERRRCMPVE